jgi:hypothetical protein
VMEMYPAQAASRGGGSGRRTVSIVQLLRLRPSMSTVPRTCDAVAHCAKI